MLTIESLPVTSKVFNHCKTVVQDKERFLLTKITAVALGAIACVAAIFIDFIIMLPLQCLKGRCTSGEPEKKSEPQVPFLEPSLHLTGKEACKKPVESDPHFILLGNKLPEGFPEDAYELLKFEIGSTCLTFFNFSAHKITVNSSREVFIDGLFFAPYTEDNCHTVFYPIRRDGDKTAYLGILEKDDNAAEESITQRVYIPTPDGLRRTKDLNASWVEPDRLDPEETRKRSDDRIYKVLDGQMAYVERTHKPKQTPEVLQFQTKDGVIFTVCNFSSYPLRMDDSGVLYVNGYRFRKFKGSDNHITLYQDLENGYLTALIDHDDSDSESIDLIFKDSRWQPASSHSTFHTVDITLPIEASPLNPKEERKANKALDAQMKHVEQGGYTGKTPEPELVQFQRTNGPLTVCNFSGYSVSMQPSGALFVNGKYLMHCEELDSLITLFPRRSSVDDLPRLGVLNLIPYERSHLLAFRLVNSSWHGEAGPYMLIGHAQTEES